MATSAMHNRAMDRLRFSTSRASATAAGIMGGASSRVQDAAPNQTTAAIAGRVMQVGQAILVAVIMLIVLGELYATDIVANPTNPNTFTNLTTTFGDYGSVAFTMIGLGLIAAGASAALAYFGSFNGGGR